MISWLSLNRAETPVICTAAGWHEKNRLKGFNSLDKYSYLTIPPATTTERLRGDQRPPKDVDLGDEDTVGEIYYNRHSETYFHMMRGFWFNRKKRSESPSKSPPIETPIWIYSPPLICLRLDPFYVGFIWLVEDSYPATDTLSHPGTPGEPADHRNKSRNLDLVPTKSLLKVFGRFSPLIASISNLSPIFTPFLPH